MNATKIIEEIKNLFKNKQEEPLVEDVKLSTDNVDEVKKDEITDVKMEDVKVEPIVDEAVAENTESIPEVEKAVELETENEMKKILDEISNLKTKLDEIINSNVQLEKENVELKKQVEELSKMDATAPVKEGVSTKEKSNYSNNVISRIEKIRKEKGLGTY